MDLIIAANSVPAAQADVVPTSGTPQLATDGNPATGVPATIAPAYHYNLMTQALVAIVDKSGIGRSGADPTVLLKALTALFGGSGAVTPTGGYWTFPGGLMVQWGQTNSGANGYTTITLPKPFPNGIGPVLLSEQNANGWIGNSSSSAVPSQHGAYNKTLTGFQVYSVNFNAGQNTFVGVAGDAFGWLAIGG